MLPDERRDTDALRELDDLLEAYAEARLAPKGAVLARLRRSVVAEVATAPTANARTSLRARSRLTFPPVLRPALVLGFAVAVGAGAGVGVFAAPPGNALYDARVALEAAFLPTQIDARLAAHAQHLDARISEADAAAARGDVVALDAALAAYQAEVDVAVAEAGEDYDRLSRLFSVLEKHVAKLSALAVRLPTQVARDNAVQHALAAGERALRNVENKKAKSNNRPSSPPGLNKGNQGQNPTR